MGGKQELLKNKNERNGTEQWSEEQASALLESGFVWGVQWRACESGVVGRELSSKTGRTNGL